MSEMTPSANGDLEVSNRSSSRYANYVLFILFSINLLNYMDRYVLTGAANVIAKELNFGVAGIGYLASAFLVFLTLGIIPLGAWADRARRKDVIAISVAAWSLITALTAFASNFLTLLISRMLLGIGEAGYAPASGAMMADYFSRSKRARILSWWATGALVGLMLGIIIGGVVAGLGFGMWRLAFLFTGIPGLILALLAWRLREPRRNQADEEAGELDLAEHGEKDAVMALVVPEKAPAQFAMLLRIKSLVALTIMQVFAFFVLAASAVYLPTLLQQRDTFGLSSGAAGLFTGIGIAIAGVMGMLFGGYLSDVLNRYHPGARILVCGIGFLIGAPSYLLSVFAGLVVHNLFVYSIFFFTTTFLLNMYAGPCIAATQDVAPSVVRASAVAISIFIAHLLGDAFSPALVGFLAGLLDPTQGQHFIQGVAGYDLGLALAYTCPPALLIAGLVGIFGARWVLPDMRAAQQADRALAR